MRIVRTVTGDLDPGTLGRTNAHEHLLQRSPLLPGDELDDAERSAAEATALRGTGIDALVELTPIGLGRDPRGLRTISERSGLRVVAATGLHHRDHYAPEHWVHRASPNLLAELFTRDLTVGCDAGDYGGSLPEPTSVRAGVIKVAARYWALGAFELRTFEAAGAAHGRTGAAVVCHLERGTAAHEVLDALEQAGIPADRVALAHADRNPDPGYHAELAARGACLGYDGMARPKYWPDSVLLECLLAVAAAGHADRLLIGGDVARRSSFRAYGGLPGMDYLPRRFLPRLRAAGGDELVSRILVHNPARLLAMPAGVP